MATVGLLEVLEVLGRLELLADFTREQRDWVAEHGEVVDVPAGTWRPPRLPS